MTDGNGSKLPAPTRDSRIVRPVSPGAHSEVVASSASVVSCPAGECCSTDRAHRSPTTYPPRAPRTRYDRHRRHRRPVGALGGGTPVGPVFGVRRGAPVAGARHDIVPPVRPVHGPARRLSRPLRGVQQRLWADDGGRRHAAGAPTGRWRPVCGVPARRTPDPVSGRSGRNGRRRGARLWHPPGRYRRPVSGRSGDAAAPHHVARDAIIGQVEPRNAAPAGRAGSRNASAHFRSDGCHSFVTLTVG